MLGMVIPENSTPFPAWPRTMTFARFHAKLYGEEDSPGDHRNASKISHPVFRYLQRALCLTMFPRSKTAHLITSSEAYIIFAALYHNSCYDAKLPDPTTFLLDHIMKVANINCSKEAIMIGGIVSRIATKLNLTEGEYLDSLHVSKYPSKDQYLWITLNYLQNIHMLSKTNNGPKFHTNKGELAPFSQIQFDFSDMCIWTVPPAIPKEGEDDSDSQD